MPIGAIIGAILGSILLLTGTGITMGCCYNCISPNFISKSNLSDEICSGISSSDDSVPKFFSNMKEPQKSNFVKTQETILRSLKEPQGNYSRENILRSMNITTRKYYALVKGLD